MGQRVKITVVLFFVRIIRRLKNVVPTFVVDAPGGGGKIALQPNYLISQSAEKVILRNFEGVIISYPEPENYIPGGAEDYFKSVYPEYEKYKSSVGIAAVMNDSKFNLIPEDLQRLDRRHKYKEDPAHTTLKNKREKRDELKERKFQAQQNKATTENNKHQNP
jgi:lysine 2,3-aminomutase